MGTFQLTYDDFTGGHYMGDHVNKQPGNTWKGSNVTLTPRGDIIPVNVDTTNTYTFTGASPISQGWVLDHWIVGGYSYVFATWEKPSAVYYSRLIVQNINDPASSPTTYTPSREFKGQAAYDPTIEKFYFASGGYIISLDKNTGTSTTISSALAGTASTNNVAISGYRLLTWAAPFGFGSTNDSSKLYYSNTARSSFATTDYYEFAGSIRAVYPRTNDIIVVTNEGTYSMVGVLGQSITIQRLLNTSDTMEGMRYSAVVGRNLVFGDSIRDGTIDGSLYEMVGATVSPIASFDSDVVISNYNSGKENMVVQNVGNGCVAVAFKTGSVYIGTQTGSWSRLSGLSSVSGTDKIRISQSSVDAQNEYFAVARVTGADTVAVQRFTFHVPFAMRTAYIFASSNTSTANGATGTMTLPDYWHGRPFTVKEVMAEWIIDDKSATYITGSAGISATVTPLGCVDVTPANVPSLTTSTASDSVTTSTLTTGWPIRTISRLRVDNANKGYGASIQIDIDSCRLRRVIVTCED